MIEVLTIETPSLGDRGYLVTDGQVALVVDAQRDFDRVTARATDRAVTITHVLETHVHNDYVTGGYALARAVGAQYLVNAADPVSFDRFAVRDGDVIDVGSMRVLAIGTPGHTFTHLAYAVSDHAAGDDLACAVFTGGSLLNGATGRTDLLGAARAEELGRAQYQSVRRLVSELPGRTAVCPTHGFGSFCSVASGSGTPGTGARSTIAVEQQSNPALILREAEFLADLLAGLDAYPAYYAHMAPANLAGPSAPDLSPPRAAESQELCRRIGLGEWVVDLRSRTAFAAGHLRGTLNFSADGSLATYLGWLIPWEVPLTLIADAPEPVAHAQRELCRIGIDRIAAAACGPVERWAAGDQLASYRCARFRDLADQDGNGGPAVLDVRRRGEWVAGHIDGAIHIPLHELADRMDELPDGAIWVHCHSGYRAAVAASMLASRGREVVAIDDEFEAAAKAGLLANSGESDG
jgi:hydroxyacylglutathione hydrolase